MELVKAAQVRSDRNRTPASCTVDLALSENKAQPACRSTRRWANRSGAVAGAWSADRGTTYAHCREAHVYLSVWSPTSGAIVRASPVSRLYMLVASRQITREAIRTSDEFYQITSLFPIERSMCTFISHTVVESSFSLDKES